MKRAMNRMATGVRWPRGGLVMAGAALMLMPAATLRADEAASAPKHKVRIVLVGDSTVTEKAGWGLGFTQFLNGDIECINTAMGGRSSMSFRDEGCWPNALALKGDYYLIQFGHNNEPGKPGRSTDLPTFAGIPPVLKEHRVAASNRGLVDGKSQTICPWDSWKQAYAHEPDPWFHDVFRRDGTHDRVEEAELIQRLTRWLGERTGWANYCHGLHVGAARRAG